MIEVTIRDMFESVPALRKLAGTAIKAKGAYQVNKIIRAVEGELKEFEVLRQGLVGKYGNLEPLPEDADDDLVASRNETLDTVRKEMDELLDTSVSLGVSKVGWEFIESLELSPSDIAALEPYLVLPE